MGNIITAAQAALALIEPAREAFDSVLADKSISFEREAGFAVQVITASDFAFKVARQNPQSVINAVTNIAAIGISLNPARKQAYLVPRDGKICLDISYMGLSDLAIASGSVRWVQAGIVRGSDNFRLSGYDKPPVHEYDPFAADRGDIRGVYVVVKTLDGDYLTHAMRIDAVWDIRDRSSAWKAYAKDGRKCPWVTDEEEMVKKTCVKQASKYWPKVERLDRAISYLNNDGGEGLDFTAAPEVQEEPVKAPVMPQRRSAPARNEVTDVAPKPAQAQAPSSVAANTTKTPASTTSSELATEGERKWVQASLDRVGIALNDACGQCGVPNFSALTKDGFVALRTFIRGAR